MFSELRIRITQEDIENSGRRRRCGRLLNRKIVEQNKMCAICHEEFTDYSDVVPDHERSQRVWEALGETITRTTFGPRTGGATPRKARRETSWGEFQPDGPHCRCRRLSCYHLRRSRSGGYDRGTSSGEPSATNPPERLARIPTSPSFLLGRSPFCPSCTLSCCDTGPGLS